MMHPFFPFLHATKTRRVRSLAWALRLACVLALLVPLSRSASADDGSSEPGAFERLIGRTVATTFPRLHYSHRGLDDEASKELFTEYFELLDPQHRYFLKADVESFSHLEERLDDLLEGGRMHFAYEVYELYLERVREQIAYLDDVLEKGFDFDVQEYYTPDRSEAPWPANKTQQEDLWRRSAKNLLLTYSMMDSRDEDESGDPSEPEEPNAQPDADEPNAESGDAGETTEALDDAQTQAGQQEDEATTEEPPPEETVRAKDKTPEERVADYYQRHLNLMESKDSIEILEMYLLALSRVYDPHSSYMAPRTEEDFDIHMKLSLEGIGALLTTEDGYVKIADIIPGGPAEQDGRLQPGDRIIEVAQGEREPVDVINMPLRKVVDMIRGPKGTEVVLTVIEAKRGLGSVPVHIELIRDEVKLKEQEAKGERFDLDEFGRPVPDGAEQAPDTSLLFISLPSFYRDFEGQKNGRTDFKSSTRDVKRLIEKHIEQGDIDGIVLDLRNNGGGSLAEAVELAGLFFAKGPVVQARYYNERTKILRDTDGEVTFAGPLVVMVNRRSASASEIVAAVLQDTKRALVVGTESTHGKGTIQTLYHLKRRFQTLPAPFNSKEPGTMKVTIGKFYRVNGGATQLRGVTPDIVFPDFSDALELGEKHLPNAMPWDAIEPVPHPHTEEEPLFIERLGERAEARNAISPAFARRVENIALFEELREDNRVPLQREARMAYHEEQERMSDLLAEERSDAEDEVEADEEDDGANTDDGGDEETLWSDADYVLKESCRLLCDLVDLRKKTPLCAIEEQFPEAEDDAADAAKPDEDSLATHAKSAPPDPAAD